MRADATTVAAPAADSSSDASAVVLPSASSISLPKGEVVILTDSNFESLTKEGVWFVDFYGLAHQQTRKTRAKRRIRGGGASEDALLTRNAPCLFLSSAPWCGHCKRLDSDWAQLASSLSAHSSIHIGKLDATEHIAQAKRFDVRGFPTLKLIRDGKVHDYRGARSVEALAAFATSMPEGGAVLPETPGQFAVAFESFVAMSGELQHLVVRQPIVAGGLILAGIALGIVLCAAAFILCLERAPQEFVRYTDRDGKQRTVPYVRPTPSAAATAAGAPNVPQTSAALKKAE